MKYSAETNNARARLVVGLILLILTGPFVLSRVDWGPTGLLWLVVWGGVVGLLSYPVATLWHSLTANRREPPY
ncbi:hypothetical protein GCM10010234_27850 [Streptomyces hawaiiensis]|uniref:hypothetical protein n=1 Tax=Streptomyces hawaiiensis TaxID=67305 RepID=UPI0031DA556D